MKTSSVSSAAISNAMRYSVMRAQNDLVSALKEAQTSRVADVGLALGARASQSVSFARDIERLNAIADSNSLASARLSSTQSALSQISAAAQSFLSTLTTSSSGDVVSSVSRDSASATLDALTSILNTSLNGEFLFAGTNTDAKPINSFSAAGSPSKAAFDAAFAAHFGFSQNDPAAANITKSQMDTFLTNAVEPQFLGSGWQNNWSNAAGQRIVSRIALNETAETSVSANNDGVRKIAMAAATISDLLSSNVSEAGRKALIERAVSLVGEGIGDLGNLQAQTGVYQKRISDASDRMKMQADLLDKSVQQLEGIDPYTASVRVTELQDQIERSYALTVRIQQLSLLKYLG